MFGKLAGKKTYIVAVMAILGAVSAHLTGDLAMNDMIQLIVTAVLGATVRNGIK